MMTLLLGGARSGKSRRALALARECPAPHTLIATAIPSDPEMAERISHHRAERGDAFAVIEEPLGLAAALALADANGAGAIVIDCLTLWLANISFEGRDIPLETDDLLRAASALRAPLLVVSNEVGLGLVPETAVGRAFRDAQGRLNQRFAAAADRVEFLAAGLPLRLKG